MFNINFHAEDDFDFTEFLSFHGKNGKFDIKIISDGTIANDAAHISQIIGVINSYNVKITGKMDNYEVKK